MDGEYNSTTNDEAYLSSPHNMIACRFSGIVTFNKFSNALIMQTFHWPSPYCQKQTTYISTINSLLHAKEYGIFFLLLKTIYEI